MREIVLIKNGELALKGLNRSSFEDVLIKNMRRHLAPLGTFQFTKSQSIHHYRYPEATGNIPKPLYTLSYPHTDKNTIFFSFSCPFASTICTQITGNGVQEAAYAKVPP